MITSILQMVVIVATILLTLIQLAEHPGDGEAKKREVTDKFKTLLAMLPLPGWLKAILGVDALVGVLIDLAVWAMNRSGRFQHGTIDDVNVQLTPLESGGIGLKVEVPFG